LVGCSWIALPSRTAAPPSGWSSRAQQRGFPAAVCAHQNGYFLLGDRKRDIINDDFFLIARREVLQNQSRLFCVVSHVNANVIKKRNKYK